MAESIVKQIFYDYLKRKVAVLLKSQDRFIKRKE